MKKQAEAARASRASEQDKKAPAPPQKPVAAVQGNIAVTPQDHLQKKISNLQKKLDDIDKLKQKIDSGELKAPEKTQLQKIERRPEIESEIEKLTREMELL
ncbi:Protein T20G5.9 [Aphelenchoides avenae]|nr:Protein T20G5.9 [Aphelenchus avenae]